MQDIKEIFKVGSRHRLNEPYYREMILVVKRSVEKGISFENELEKVSNRLETKVPYFFGWAGLQIYLDKGSFKKAE